MNIHRCSKFLAGFFTSLILLSIFIAPAQAIYGDIARASVASEYYFEVTEFDNTAPSVVSINRVNPNPTTLAKVNYLVTFSEPVIHVGLSDFQLKSTGIPGLSIAGMNGSGTTYTISVNTGKLANGLININTATAEELDALPGIGPTIAQRIIDYRTQNGPFEWIEDIKYVQGIGDATFEEIKDLITTSNGSSIFRLDIPIYANITDLAGNPLGGLPFTNGQTYTVTKKYTSRLITIASQDGWLLESGETTNKGGILNTAATTIYLGDNAQKKQYRSILSFTTKGLPDNAVITKVTLKVKKQGIAGGGNPLDIFQGFIVDVKKGFFSPAARLQPSDFQAKANKSLGPFKPAPVNGWYTINLTTAKDSINKLTTNGGVTQIRMRFKLDDNNNGIANYLKLYSGNATVASRPLLIIEYYVP